MIFPCSWPAVLIKKTTNNNCEGNRQAITQALQNTSRDHISSRLRIHPISGTNAWCCDYEGWKNAVYHLWRTRNGCINRLLRKPPLWFKVAGKYVNFLPGVFDSLAIFTQRQNRTYLLSARLTHILRCDLESRRLNEEQIKTFKT